ncbi:hypothetical protein KG091_07835 [Carnobacteriaceae bacterium zg-ZUI78]|nr:hypothetical protein [Carnobacteriaceae bacterium zg-ZUI78]
MMQIKTGWTEDIIQAKKYFDNHQLVLQNWQDLKDRYKLEAYDGKHTHVLYLIKGHVYRWDGLRYERLESE